MSKKSAVHERAKLLRNIAISFVVLTIALLGVVAYAALSRAVVTVTLSDVERDVVFQIPLVQERLDSELPPRAVQSTFLEFAETITDTFLLAGEEKREGRAGGVVTIHNETDRDQPLVATTRLLTTDGLLFRIVEGVRVPAGGQVTVVAQADEEGEAYAIGPERFLIPGLSASLQKNIYATSTTPMVFGGAKPAEVTEQDIENARQELRRRLLNKAASLFNAQVAEEQIDERNLFTEIIEEESSVVAGEEAIAFTLAIKFRVVGVLFDKQDLSARIREEVGGNARLASGDKVQYEIRQFDEVQRQAVLRGRATVVSAVDKDSSIFSTINFVSDTPDEVKKFLQNYEGVADVDVALSPYWQTKLPRLPERIQVRFRQ